EGALKVNGKLYDAPGCIGPVRWVVCDTRLVPLKTWSVMFRFVTSLVELLRTFNVIVNACSEVASVGPSSAGWHVPDVNGPHSTRLAGARAGPWLPNLLQWGRARTESTAS